MTGAAPLLETDSSDRGQVIAQGADRQPAAERPRLCRSRAAQPRRAALGDFRFARRLVQRQRSAERAEQLHPRRRRQQLVRHEQPGILEPGRPGLSRRGRGVQGADQQLQRRIRPDRRRGHQRVDAQRHERVPRDGLGIQSQHVAQRGRVLQPIARRQAEARSEPVRLRLRRADRAKPHVLLRRLRRVPPDSEGDHVCQHPDARAARRGFSAGRF